MAKVAIDIGLDPQKDFALEVLLLTGELGSPAMMENLGALWGAKAYNFLYGAQEALVLGTVARTGRMHTFPMNFFYEVIDAETGRRAPSVDGARSGELVITMLFQGSKPLVRYRTGDFVRLCDAGPGDVFPSPVVEVLGRTRDALELNGHVVQGYDVEQLLFQHVRGALGYRITISNDGRDRLDIALDMIDGVAQPEMTDAIRTTFARALDTEAHVTFESLGSIGSTSALVSWKAARIVDTRPKKEAGLEAERLIAQQIAAARDRLYASDVAKG